VRRLRRLALVAGTLVAVFVAVLAVTFPTEQLLRALLARVTAPGSPTVSFERARLRPWGLRVDMLAAHAPDGTVLADAEWATVRPSLLGLLRDRTGRPWRAAAGTCGGRLDAVVDREAGTTIASLTWNAIDLARCRPVALLGETVAGVIGGTAVVRRAPGASAGEIALQGGMWKGAGRFVPAVETLHADPASIRWTLQGGRLELTAIAIDGPEVRATGGGTVRLASVPRDSTLALSLVVAPGPQASPSLRDLMARLPPTGEGETRRLEIEGTIGAPRLVREP